MRDILPPIVVSAYGTICSIGSSSDHETIDVNATISAGAAATVNATNDDIVYAAAAGEVDDFLNSLLS
jgi:hypothetical protein